MEFHVSREARDRYGFGEALFSLAGNVVLADFRATRTLVRQMNSARDVAGHPELAVQPGQLNAMGLIDEILHHVSALYRRRRDPQALEAALAALDASLGAEVVNATLAAFVDRYPPTAVYGGDESAGTWLAGTTDGLPNRQVALEELAHLWLANVNPAFAPFHELFDDRPLAAESAYEQVIEALAAHFAARPPFGPENQTLVAMLRSPAIASPDSLSGQLRYIRQRWGMLLEGLLDGRLELSLDVLNEEERALWLRFHGWDEAAALARGQRVGVYQFGDQELEPERFSMDRDWMPRLVLMAKSTYVWLDQLAREYQREVGRLDQVPDEELDRLARWGFTGLWLIGLWERSRASERIKRLRGNPDAVASAYSLLDYRIADDLGGEAAFENLRERAWRRGIRLASDMVPNHMGIDSAWVMEHPDWFISLDDPPYPAYSYGGPDLSSDGRVGLWIEDHYYDNSDAAVVFRREDRATGENRFVYHGNDGTSMPWNDTAQLDYLRPDVREAVIQTILAVAHRFPVIRFDAAMTLAKKHYQRLWYPEPGSGGAIPSRAEHGMTRAEFDERMPVEFWREVVDRVAAEAPDTLLLAEAFWLMEGYFVRTLGMHRVYNSAFMNMLRDEENAKYRQVLKNTLEYDPEILWRYVNFMSNPDERTAVDQFGKGDKYIGVAVMMATIPGLPMFGHGQVEGFYERYGMEYRRAYYDESPDSELIGHHEREIAPLLRRRYLFSGVDRFLLYDFFTPDGAVDENVFAYSNRAGDERALIVYHNRFAETRGWIRSSVAYNERQPSGERRLIQRTLGDGLGLTPGGDAFAIFHDRVTGLEHIRSCQELTERGLYLELAAYGRHVFVDFREVQSTERAPYARLAELLGGAGVPSVDLELRRLALEPALQPLRELLEPAFLQQLLRACGRPSAVETDFHEPAVAEVERRARKLVLAIADLTGRSADADALAASARAEVEAVLDLPARSPGQSATARARSAARYWGVQPDDAFSLGTLLAIALVRPFALAAGHGAGLSAWLDEWTLRDVISGSLMGIGLDYGQAQRATSLVGVIADRPLRSAGARSGFAILAGLLETDEGQRFVFANWHGGVLWLNREALVELRWWLGEEAVLAASIDGGAADLGRALVSWRAFAEAVDRCAQGSAFHLDLLVEGLRALASPRRPRVVGPVSDESGKGAGKRLDERETE